MITTTVSSYLNSISPQAPEFPLAQTILNTITLAASTTNVALANSARAQLPSLLDNLLETLIDNRRFTASTVLALMAAASVANAGGAQGAVAVLGPCIVSGGVIAFTSGAY